MDIMTLTRNLFIFLIGLFLLASPPIASANEATNLKGAVCVIRSDDKVVMVNEILTKKLALPAGTILEGEDPAIAAQRETWEETGLVVSIVDELGRTDEAIIFDCVSDSDIVAFQFNNHFDGNELPVWFAPHYGVEIASAMLIDPRVVPKEAYRFPEQLTWLIDALPNASDQPVIYVGNLVEAAPEINQIELDWMVELQNAVHRLPSTVSFTIEQMIFSGGLLASPVILLIILPLLYWKFGKQFAYKVFFAVTVTSLLALVAQQGFAHPRPHVYIPAVELQQSYGYSLPSLSVAIWFCVGTLVLNATNRLSINQWSVALILIVAWMSFSRFYSGAAFLLDSISGALLGALCAWHIIRLDVKRDVDLMQLLSSKAVWLSLVVLCAVLTFFWPIPAFTYWLAITITVSALVATLRLDQSKASGLAIAIAALLTIGLDLALDNWVVTLSHSGLLSLIAETVRYPIMILLFVMIIRINSKFRR
jgi:8-oxo-dGTP pyrophosphatase MutT (NUDIX family)/membrane-associated phospholipid phosphatase